jgi:hypothetical protein
MRPDFQVILDEVVAEVILSVLPCATIQWNHAQHVYKVGDKIDRRVGKTALLLMQQSLR